MNTVKIIAGVLVAAPMAVFAFTGTVATPAFVNVALAGYGQDKVKVCHTEIKKGKIKSETLKLRVSSVLAYISTHTGHRHIVTVGKCPKPPKDHKHEDKHDDRKEDHKDKDKHDDEHKDRKDKDKDEDEN